MIADTANTKTSGATDTHQGLGLIGKNEMMATIRKYTLAFLLNCNHKFWTQEHKTETETLSGCSEGGQKRVQQAYHGQKIPKRIFGGRYVVVNKLRLLAILAGDVFVAHGGVPDVRIPERDILGSRKRTKECERENKVKTFDTRNTERKRVRTSSAGITVRG